MDYSMMIGDEELLFNFLDDLIEELYTIHINGVCHGDININNIVLTNEKKFKLINFKNNQISIQCIKNDIYNLGITAYKLFTGNNPFINGKYLPYRGNRKLGKFIDILILQPNRTTEEIYKMWLLEKIISSS